MAVNQIKAGVILNYVTIVLNALVGLLYTPYMLRMMGQSEYGLYSLVASVIGYLTIMDFGFGNAIIRYTAKFRAEGKTDKQYSMFGMFFVIYTLIGVLAIIGGITLFLNVDSMFGDTMTTIELQRAKVMMLIMTFNLGITFPLGIFGSIIIAYENFVFQKLFGIGRIILNTAVMIVLLHFGYKAIAMVVVQTVFNVLTLFINVVYCHKKIGIHLEFNHFEWGFLKEVAIYSFWIFLNAIMDKIYWSTGQFVLGAVIGTACVAVFSVAIHLKDIYYTFSCAISNVLLPRVTTMITTGASNQTISDLFIRVGRLQYLIISYILTIFILFGRPFITIWAGDNYQDVYLITLLFFASTAIPLIQNVGMTILQARNQLKYRSILILIVSTISLIFMIPAAKHYGAIGAASVIATAVVLGHGIILNIYYNNIIRINIIQFWMEIFKMSIIPAIMVILGFYCIRIFEIPIDNLMNLIIVGGLFSIIYITATICLTMNKYEKQLILDPIIRRIRNK